MFPEISKIASSDQFSKLIFFKGFSVFVAHTKYPHFNNEPYLRVVQNLYKAAVNQNFMLWKQYN
jgi:hypothetical protein